MDNRAAYYFAIMPKTIHLGPVVVPKERSTTFQRKVNKLVADLLRVAPRREMEVVPNITIGKELANYVCINLEKDCWTLEMDEIRRLAFPKSKLVYDEWENPYIYIPVPEGGLLVNSLCLDVCLLTIFLVLIVCILFVCLQGIITIPWKYTIG